MISAPDTVVPEREKRECGPVAIDVFPALVPSGGIGRYVGDLVRAFRDVPGAPAERLVHPGGKSAEAARRFPHARLHGLPFGWRGLRLAYASTIALGIPLDGWFGDAALVHATMGVAPVLARIPLVVTVHDLTAIEHPEWHPAPVSALARATLPSAIRRATTVVCDSEHVRGRVLAAWGGAPERVITVPLALSPDFVAVDPVVARGGVARRLGLEGPFVLHVGTWEPRKNHVTLLSAFDAMVRAGFPGRLVLVGHDGWRSGPIFERLSGISARERVLRVTDADDSLLAALYGTATALAFPSLDEGFGLPLLEAMAHGCPAVCSDGGSLPEVAGGASRVVPAMDADALADALLSMWRDEGAREAASALGRRRAEHFAFEPWARRMFRVYAAAHAPNAARPS
ncbi:MAG: glycosyltransferase family 4 protein [Candidatus Eisenbacteria bacterium]|nr:glycosyltransferase family 4 protein [Candidatus Eisenbacteria bacterium]